jgi:hypothetical protein
MVNQFVVKKNIFALSHWYWIWLMQLLLLSSNRMCLRIVFTLMIIFDIPILNNSLQHNKKFFHYQHNIMDCDIWHLMNRSNILHVMLYWFPFLRWNKGHQLYTNMWATYTHYLVNPTNADGANIHTINCEYGRVCIDDSTIFLV